MWQLMGSGMCGATAMMLTAHEAPAGSSSPVQDGKQRHDALARRSGPLQNRKLRQSPSCNQLGAWGAGQALNPPPCTPTTQALLRQVAKSELAALGRTNADFARSAAEAIAAARAPAPQPTADPQQARELQQLRGEKAALQERLAQLQEQVGAGGGRAPAHTGGCCGG